MKQINSAERITMNIRKLTSIVTFCTVVFMLCSCTNSNNPNLDKNYNDENSKISFSESEITNVDENACIVQWKKIIY